MRTEIKNNYYVYVTTYVFAYYNILNRITINPSALMLYYERELYRGIDWWFTYQDVL